MLHHISSLISFSKPRPTILPQKVQLVTTKKPQIILHPFASKKSLESQLPYLLLSLPLFKLPMHLILSCTSQSSTKREILESKPDGKHVPCPNAQALWNDEQQRQLYDEFGDQWVTYLQVLSEQKTEALMNETACEKILVVDDELDQCRYVFLETNGVTQWCVTLSQDASCPEKYRLPDTGSFKPCRHELFSASLVPVKDKTMRSLGVLTNLVNLQSLLEANNMCRIVRIYLMGSQLMPFYTEHVIFGNARLDQFFELLCGDRLEPNFTLRMVREGGLRIPGTLHSYETAKSQRLLLKDLKWDPMEKEFVYLMAEPHRVTQL